MGSLYSKNLGAKNLLYVIDVFSQYTRLKLLKDKKYKTILNGFIGLVNE